MESKKLQEMSEEELLKQYKTIQVVTGSLAFILTLLLIAVILLAIKKGFDAIAMGLGVIPFALLPILFINWNSLKEINKELNSRKNVA